MTHRSMEELVGGLDHVRRSPTHSGRLEMIVSRPGEGERIVHESGDLHPDVGLVGDTWVARGSARTADGTAHPDMQLNLMNARAIQLIAGDRSRWPLAGDQLYVDFDLSEENLPAWTRLGIGGAVIQVTDQPHRGCAKFSSRYGVEALRWVNSEEGRALHLRGINAKVLEAGTARVGDPVLRLD